MEATRSIRPDILILDLMLTELDGIALLHAIQDGGLHPMVLVVTSMYTPYVLRSLEAFGISYIIRKPCDPLAVVQRIHDFNQLLVPRQTAISDPSAYITYQLNRLSFSPRHRGFAYLRESILLMYREPRLSITKEIYPTVSRICGSQPVLVERSIRNAINVAWQQSHGTWNQLLYPAFEGIVSRPSNGVFIIRLAEDLRSKAQPDPEST